jgi:hypothetical protein
MEEMDTCVWSKLPGEILELVSALPLPVATPRNKLQQTQARSTQHLHSISQLSTSLKDQSSKNTFQRNTIFYQTHIL